MTSRDWRADRRAVFDRDGFACRHCGAGGGDDGAATLRVVPVGDVALEGEVHASVLVTVCEDCVSTLNVPSGTARGPDDPFRLVRETTRLQGETISDVADFASLATSLPDSLESVLEAGADDRGEPVSEYRRTRRDVRLALTIADARIEAVAALEPSVGSETGPSVAAFAEAATDLQSILRDVVRLSETVATALERCHGCFGPLEGDACERCGLAARETADWRGEDGRFAFDRLFAAINERLQEASGTTETLTDRTTTLADHLVAD